MFIALFPLYVAQRILETGSLVQFGDPVQYGVIKRIETAVDTFANIAEVETVSCNMYATYTAHSEKIHICIFVVLLE